MAEERSGHAGRFVPQGRDASRPNNNQVLYGGIAAQTSQVTDDFSAVLETADASLHRCSRRESS